MINVTVRTNTTRKTVNYEIDDTPRKVFDDLGVDVSASMVNINGTTIKSSDMDKTFEQLNVSDGSAVNLNSIVKADGANK